MNGLRRQIAGGEHMLISGEVQFWRMAPQAWGPALAAVKALGIDHIATYLSWRRHEPRPGSADFRGAHGAALDVHRFLGLCAEHAISVQLKPGPWICAEEPGGGLPDWIIGAEEMIARDHAGRPVLGYNPPFKHPMPSYASPRFRQAAATWLRTVWRELAEWTGPGGPIVATQLDNEPSLGFQDSMYGFDYHPDSLSAFRAFALARHGTLDDLAAAWGEKLETAADIAPPRPADRRGDAVSPTPREACWMAYQRHYIASYLGWLQQVNREAGVGALVSFVNLNTHPVRGLPQSGAAIGATLRRADDIAVVGEDHYFVPRLDAGDLTGLALAAAQGMASGSALVWAPEVQAGIWRSPGEIVDYPDPSDEELAGWWAASLALGYQGLNLYMLVDRENWQFAPVSAAGAPRPLAEHVAHLLRTIDAVPNLAAYRPVAQAVLAWDEPMLDRAYRVAGTQAAPVTAWDDPRATADYRAIVSHAATLTARGVQFRLGTASDGDLPLLTPASPPAALAIRPPVHVDASGVLARLHRHPDGDEIVYVVPWAHGATRRPRLVLADTTIRALRPVLSGAAVAVSPGGEATIAIQPGLNLLRVLRG